MKIEVFYNKSCNICRKEISIYKKFSGENINYIDIFGNNFGKSLTLKKKKKLIRRLHVTSDLKTYVGAEAFLEIWKNIPKFKTLYNILKIKPIFLLFKIFYEAISFFLFLKSYHLIKKK